MQSSFDADMKCFLSRSLQSGATQISRPDESKIHLARNKNL